MPVRLGQASTLTISCSGSLWRYCQCWHCFQLGTGQLVSWDSSCCSRCVLTIEKSGVTRVICKSFCVTVCPAGPSGPECGTGGVFRWRQVHSGQGGWCGRLKRGNIDYYNDCWFAVLLLYKICKDSVVRCAPLPHRSLQAATVLDGACTVFSASTYVQPAVFPHYQLSFDLTAT